MLRWGLSILDFRHHAIDERSGHPSGVYRAECGHLLLTVTVLREEPAGPLCEACADLQLARAQAAQPTKE